MSDDPFALFEDVVLRDLGGSPLYSCVPRVDLVERWGHRVREAPAPGSLPAEREARSQGA